MGILEFLGVKQQRVLKIQKGILEFLGNFGILFLKSYLAFFFVSCGRTAIIATIIEPMASMLLPL